MSKKLDPTKIAAEELKTQEEASGQSALSEAAAPKTAQVDQSIKKFLDENPAIGEIVKKNPEIEQKLSLVVESNHFSGPLPHPDLLRSYNDIQDGFAERIIMMAEKDAEHIRDMQRSALTAKRSEVGLGQWFGFLIGVIALICGTIATVFDHPIVGTLIGTGGVIGLVSIFIFGRSKTANNKNSGS